MKENSLETACFERFEITLPSECVSDCSHQGDCGEDVRAWASRLKLVLDPDALRGELYGYGAWEEWELSDHEVNIRRIIWIAACNIKEDRYQSRE